MNIPLTLDRLAESSPTFADLASQASGLDLDAHGVDLVDQITEGLDTLPINERPLALELAAYIANHSDMPL